MNALHRILSGQALTPRQIMWAGIFVAQWYAMDLIQFIDWLWSKL